MASAGACSFIFKPVHLHGFRQDICWAFQRTSFCMPAATTSRTAAAMLHSRRLPCRAHLLAVAPNKFWSPPVAEQQQRRFSTWHPLLQQQSNTTTNKLAKYFQKHEMTETDVYASKFDDNKEYRPIYIFKYILPARLFQRSKVWLFLIFLFTGLGYSAYLKYSGTPLSVLDNLMLLGSLSVPALGLCLFSLYFGKLIGRMYVSSDGSMLMLSVLDFWGHRMEFFAKVKEIVPLDQITLFPYEHNFVKFKLSHRKDIKWTYSLKHGRVLDPIAFDKIFCAMDPADKRIQQVMANPFGVYYRGGAAMQPNVVGGAPKGYVVPAEPPTLTPDELHQAAIMDARRSKVLKDTFMMLDEDKPVKRSS